MSLKDRLLNDMKESMKNKDKDRLSVIRMARAAILNAEKEKMRELEEGEVIEVLAREVKQRKESLPEFEKGNRPDLVEKIQKEIDVLMEYLPKQLTETEIEDIVRQTIMELGVNSLNDMGKVMGKLMPQLKGRADGSLVNKIVKQLLQ
ncbi:MAG: GatB/YqeY domain-containing protein [Firmicutes bacterium]|nr:GatB/YqeY domain-containing protein [Bacillota bacterium]